ncbi:cytokinin riboside 5'-monophosphate phosphoribohydrolase [Iodidimonas muriae]|uniref:Cytokinin riboside 5'-monophosphate phosphoribohydrolase n=1 Tax=Iodidimonas muriae TaxID=261467 RepID=A0ABQ2LEK4_9PROT|nr:TIGR00730 family Rossman fold protein [Iodidimonas muriae]GER07436.1 cytokinin riboside 5'-monophosphate phosphoribohydrolase [Kordiimonadales bacterium JCM 17843]GGO10519.1 cytokinin riboside 5'-monophosphate phosphoribohydrolase [Iodidimonas muriae]
MNADKRRSAFPSASEDEQRARRTPDTPQTRSPAYRLAFTDLDFLKRDALRPTRLQLELMKPELLLQEHGVDATVVIFGSARSQRFAKDGSNDDLCGRDYEAARALARLISQAEGGCPEKLMVVTGGGPGIMEAGNRGAHDVGAESIGLNIVLPHEQAPNPYITPELCFQFHYFALRKMHFLMRARALVCFPGGFGTMDELFETLTLIQTGKIDPIPVLLYRKAWWDSILNLQVMADAGMIAHKDLDLIQYVESAEEAWETIRDYCKSTCANHK